MKTKKLLMPILGVSAMAAVTATPLMSLTSCSPTVSDVLNMWNDGHGNVWLGGFKKGVSKGTIKKVFGDTLTIPKQVKYFTPYAFVDKDATGQPSTIPDFIKHFRFEDGYKCTEIADYAFYGAPFETVEFTCEREDGFESKGKGWDRPENGWGITTLGQQCFFETKKLKYIKFPGSLKKASEKCFGYTEDGIVKSNVTKLDLSDYNIDDSSMDALVTDFHKAVSIFPFETPATTQGEILLRSYNGTDSLKLLTGEGEYKTRMDMCRSAFGYLGQPEYTWDSIEFGSWTIVYPAMINMNQFGVYPVDGSMVKGISTERQMWSRTPDFMGDKRPIKLKVDLTKWRPNLPNVLRLYSPATIKQTENLKVLVDGVELQSSDFKRIDGNHIDVYKRLSKKSSLEFQFNLEKYNDLFNFVITKGVR